MNDSRLRRELAASFRLFAREERRLWGGLAAIALCYPVWVAGTGVAVSRVATSVLGPVTVDPWTYQTTAHVGLFAFLWVVLPAGIAAGFAIEELTNLRGNIRQCYRFGRPALLLAPPVVGYALGLAAVVVEPAGIGREYVFGALAALSFVFLVRVVAFGYRVYALSIPRILQATLFAGSAALSIAGLARSAKLAGQEAFVREVAVTAGIPEFVDGTVTTLGVAVQTPLWIAVVGPAAFGAVYVVAQFLAGLVVRVRKPTVTRKSMRAGQRYPTFVDVATSSTTVANPDAPSDRNQTPSEPRASADAAGSERQTTAKDTGGERTDATDATDDGKTDVQRVGQTRVYSPSGDGSDAGSSGAVGDESPVGEGPDGGQPTQVTEGGAVKSEMCPICGATFEADPNREHCPNCNAIIDTD